MIEIDSLKLRDELVALLSELVRIDSSNSWLVQGGAGEKDVQAFAARWLEAEGIETREEPIDAAHMNVYAAVPGSGGNVDAESSREGAPRSLTLYAHADTVGYELWADEALVPRLDGDKLYGLGSADDKGHLAAMMLAAKYIKAGASSGGVRLRGDLHLAIVADEEGETIGSFDYVKKHEPEACLILESAPASEINVTHQGFGWLRIHTYGKAGHGSAGASSVDAIAAMAEVIVRLQRNKRDLFEAHPDPLNLETVYHTSYIKGGTDFASYPDSCELGIEIGTQAGESIEDRVREIEDIFAEIRRADPAFHGEVEVVLSRSPFVSKGSDELYGILAEHVHRITGAAPERTGDNSWGDAQIFQDAGFATLGIGAPGGGLHAPGEWVSISGLVDLVKILIATIEEYCG